MKTFRTAMVCGTVIALGALAGLTGSTSGSTSAQRVNPNSNTERGGADVRRTPGRKIGAITTRRNIIQLELAPGVIAEQNLFDLDNRTVRFTPSNGGFRVETMPLQWEAATGSTLQGETVRLTKFSFPFSDILSARAT